MSDGRILQIFRDGDRFEDPERIQLPTGAQANLKTLGYMAKIVREDSQLRDIRNFAFDRIIGRENKPLASQIDAAFSFCRDQILYAPEGEGTETVADLWSCCYRLNDDHPVGDCAIKSVALATCLSYLKLKPRFVALQQIPDADFYNHVYVGVTLPDGTFEALDPTPPEFTPGEALTGYGRLEFPIFK